MALLSTTLTTKRSGEADLVIEAVFEEMGVKQKVFETLDEVMKPGAILASNTSTLDVDKIAAFTKRPQDVVGLHFFSPANVMKLLEVVRGEDRQGRAGHRDGAGQEDQEDGRGLRRHRRLHRQPHDRAVQPPGRLPAGRRRDAAAGGPAIEKFGFAMGPFRMGDLAGNDIGWAIRKRRAQERPNMLYSRTADKLCELGRFGQKTGAGWYDYQAGKRDAIPSKLVEDMIVEHRKSLGIEPRKISDEEIVQRLVFALVNEGAHIVEEGIAARASDIDMVYLTGYGFPIHRGGPMLYADQVGLFNVVQAMKRFQQNPRDDAKFWEPAPLLQKLVAEGKTFN
jgi:3-hydroxyacyl-CoA dehydrogenase